MPALTDKALLAWVRHVSQHATWMASVCTGASIYAAAGILAGRRATTHWAFRDVLASMGVTVCPGRVVFDEPFISCAGVSAGIDMALASATAGPRARSGRSDSADHRVRSAAAIRRRRTTQGKRPGQTGSGYNARGRRLPVTAPRPWTVIT
jgi:transcriptional regulator GlxA family with amidase domain